MCGTCGCSDPDNEVSMLDPANGERTLLRGDRHAHHDHGNHSHDHHHHGHEHDHHHGHDHDHSHGHDHSHHHHDHGDEHGHRHAHNNQEYGHGERDRVTLETAVLARNDLQAARNRGWFEGRGVVALNLVSSPGAGKTTLLEATIRALDGRIAITVIEGDQQTANDAARIRDAGARAIQINTGAGCHLEADMVSQAAAALAPARGSILMIENVGNLVCPAMFDLGERMKVVVISTPEGEDKPLKYPHMFRAARLVVINKVDLAPHVGFDEAACRANIAAVNPEARIMTLSARTGQGMDAWLGVLDEQVAATVNASG
jgi:hydrogenase nickel incorporation protein HypB